MSSSGLLEHRSPWHRQMYRATPMVRPMSSSLAGAFAGQSALLVGDNVWAPAKADGHPRAGSDTSRARQEFGLTASTSFEDGLRGTIDWYEECLDESSIRMQDSLDKRHG